MPSRSDVAIVGLSCVFPGARDVQQFWSNILNKVDAVSDAPPDWGAEYVYDPDSGANDRTYCKRGGFLRELADFDPARYGVMPNAVDGTEPDHFLALRAACEALRDAGYADTGPYRERTEVIIGRGTYVNRGNTTAVQHSIILDSVLRVLRQLHPEHTDEELKTVREALKSTLPPFHADTAAGLVPNIISGRIANRLDLMGANYIVDAACASSIVAIDLAIRDLRAGRCDMVVAGGVNASVPPVIMIIFSQLKALSRKGAIRPFSSDADGTLLAEGVGMAVLKRLEDAERDGDRIYAVVKGTGVASDGRALGLLAPRLEGEELALRRAYEDAGVHPSTVGLIEAHGTATPVGDAVEVEALTRVFGARDNSGPVCALGSVKSMIGHTMPAAGMAGLIKTALALHHKVLPPTLHCDSPNPKLGLGESRFYLNTDTRPWIHGEQEQPRRAGINAFGFGGINAHVVLEEYAGPNRPPNMQPEWDAELFIVSAETPEALPAAVDAALARLAAEPDPTPLRNIAWRMNCTAAHGPARLAVVAAGAGELATKLQRAKEKLANPRTRRIREMEGIYFYREPLGASGKVAFIFPGEGAQYPGMLADLARHFPQVREWFDRMDRAFAGHPRGYVLSQALFPPAGSAPNENLWSMDIGAEAVFCGNQALYALLATLGIRPDAMVGHSTGEHTALLASGIVQAVDEAELLRHIRGVNQVFEAINSLQGIPEGQLLAIAGADHNKLEQMVAASDGTLFIALDNCPHQVVLFGSKDKIGEVVDSLARTPAICQQLPFGRAYHTPWFREFAERLRAHFETLNIAAPATPVYSCVTAGLYPAGKQEIVNLAAVQWASTVRFRETVEAMYRDGVRIFVEVGPRGNLTAFLGDILRGKAYCGVAANVQFRSGILQLQHLVAELFAAGVAVDLAKLYDGRVQPPAEAKSGRPMKLSMGLQPVGLPNDFRLPQRPVSPAVAAVVEPAPRAAAAAAQAPASALEPTGRHVAIARHLETMSQFLAVQQQVLGAWLGSRQTPAATPATGAAKRVFITEVLELVPGVRAKAKHHFSVARERLFADHTFCRDLSRFDSSLTGLPVVPLTVTMEILAEAGALLAPGKVLTGMRDIRAHRWLALEHGELVVDIDVEVLPDAEGIRVRLREAGEPLRPVSAEGTMVFADSYPPAPPAAPARFDGERASAWQSARLYTDGMFHGPAFRAVEKVDRTGSNGSSSTFRVLPREALIQNEPSPAFLTDPVILDAAGQAVAFWSQEVLQPCGDIFPYRLRALHCWQPPSAPGSALTCNVFVRHVGQKEIRSDIELVDSLGRLHYRFEDWEDVRILLPKALWDLRIAPRDTYVATRWNDPVRHANHQLIACARVDLPRDIFEASHGIWLKVLAYIVLSAKERAEFHSFKAGSKRQYDWLMGRCAVKDAVRMLVKQRFGEQLAPAEVEIAYDAGGRPVVSGAWAGGAVSAPSVSLSHTSGRAVAIASCDAGALVGIDVEDMTRVPEQLESDALTAEEQDLIRSLPHELRQEWFLRFWCAKESVGKALGTGLSTGLQSLSVAAMHADEGAVEIELRKGLAESWPGLRHKRVRVNTCRDNNFICSTALVERRLV
jgi:phosphopantetheine--protein transferase-like protein